MKDNDQYRVRQTKNETRQTAQSKLTHLLFTGSAFDFEKDIADGVHTQSGLAGVSVLKQTGNGWKLLAAQSHGWAGSFGSAPETESRLFHESDKDKQGFLALHGDARNGYAGSVYQLFVHDGVKKTTKSSITAEAGNAGTLDDCSENFYKGRKSTVIERRRYLSKLCNLSSRIKILKNGKTSAGFYSLQLTASGLDGSERYTNKVFITAYNSTKGYYNTPKDYPLADKDF